MNEELRRLTPDLVFEEVLASFIAQNCPAREEVFW